MPRLRTAALILILFISLFGALNIASLPASTQTQSSKVPALIPTPNIQPQAISWDSVWQAIINFLKEIQSYPSELVRTIGSYTNNIPEWLREPIPKAYANPSPVVVSTAAVQYSTPLGLSRKLIYDKYGKYLAYWIGTTNYIRFAYSNDAGANWTVASLGSTFAAASGEQFGVATAYDSTNDKVMMAWVTGKIIKLAQMTFTRDGSNNITAYTAGAILSITMSTVTGGDAAIDATCNPSMWMLHNGEVQVAVGGYATAGTITAGVWAFRAVFNSPPTFKNAAGTASAVNKLSAAYTTALNTIFYPTVVQRTNAGTGQYDFFVVWSYNVAATLLYYNKASWSSPNWSFGGQTNFADSGYMEIYLSGNYDAYDGLIVIAAVSSGLNGIDVWTLNSSEAVTNPWDNAGGNTMRSATLGINQLTGDWYVFFDQTIVGGFNGIQYAKYTQSTSSWGANTDFKARSGSETEKYPNVTVDNTGNYFGVLWTHYTGSAYNVYYDALYVPLIQSYQRAVSVSINQGASNISRLESLKKASSVAIAQGNTPSRIEGLQRTNTGGLVVPPSVYVVTGFARGASETIVAAIAGSRSLSRLTFLPQSLSLGASTSRILSLGAIISLSIAQGVEAAWSAPMFRLLDLLLGVSPSASRTATMPRTLAETITNAINGSRMSSLERLFSLPISSTATDTRALSLFKTVSQNIVNGVTQVRTLSLGRTESQEIITSAQVSRLEDLFKTISQTIVIGVSDTRLVSYERSTSQGPTLSVNLSRLISLMKTASQNILVGITSVRTMSLSQMVNQPISSTVVPTKTISLSKTVSIAISNGVTNARIGSFPRSVTQENSISPTVDRVGSDLRTIAQNVAAALSPTRRISLFSTVSQAITVGITGLRVGSYLRSGITLLAVGIDIAQFSGVTKTISQTITNAVSNSRNLSLLRTDSQTILFGIDLSKMFGMSVIVSHTIVATITSNRLASYERSPNQIFTLNANLDRLISLMKAASQNIVIGIASARTISFSKTANQPINSTVILTRMLSLDKTVSIAISQGVTDARIGSFPRSAPQETTISPTVDRINSDLRTVIQSIVTALFPTRSISLFPTISQAITVGIIGERLGSYERVASQAISLDQAVERLASLMRTTAQTIAVAIYNARGISLFKTNTTNQTIGTEIERTISISEQIAQTIVQSVSPSRTESLPRSTSQPLTLNTLVSTLSGFLRNIAQSTEETTNVSRVLQNFRLAGQIITATISGQRILSLQRIAESATTIGISIWSQVSAGSLFRNIDQAISVVLSPSRTLSLGRGIAEAILQGIDVFIWVYVPIGRTGEIWWPSPFTLLFMFFLVGLVVVLGLVQRRRRLLGAT